MSTKFSIIPLNFTNAAVFSSILFSINPLIASCSSKSYDTNTTSENNSVENVYSTSETSRDKLDEKNIVASNKEIKTTDIQPKKLTQQQIEQVKQALPNKNLIVNHAFQVNLKDFGTSFFVPVSESIKDSPQPKLTLNLIKDGQIKYTFPQIDDVKTWNFLELNAVSFEKQNASNNGTGVLVVSKYWAGPGGPGSSEPFPVAIFYTQSENGFQVNKEVTKKLIDKQVKTIAEARSILKE